MSAVESLRAEGDAAGELLGQVLVTRALADLHVDGPAAARRTLGEARRTAASVGSRYVAALACVQEGTIAMYRGDWTAGLAALDQVIEADLRSPAEVLAVLLNRGLANITLRRPLDGRRDLRAALKLAAQQDWPEVVFKAQHNLGCLEFFMGHLPEAIRIMQEADEMPVRVDRLQSRRDIAAALLEVGLVDPAERLLRLALRSARRRRLRLDEGNILLDLVGAQLLGGDVRAAARSAAAATRAFGSYGDEQLAAHADLMAAAVEMARGRPGRPVDPSLVGTRTATGRTATRLTAEQMIDAGDPRGAAALLDELSGSPAEGIDTVMHEHLLRARIAVDSGDGGAAQREFRSAAMKLTRMQGSVASLEARAAVAVHGSRLAGYDVSEAMRLGDPRSVFRAVERWRAASQRLPAVRPHPDPAVASMATQLRQLRRDVQTGEGGDALRADIAALEGRLARRLWAAGAVDSQAGPAPVSYRALRARLRESGTTLLYYFRHAGSIHLLCCGPQGASVRLVSQGAQARAHAERLEADLRVRAQAAADGPLGAAIDRGVTRTLERLDELLLPELDPLTQAVLLVPTRELGSLPWTMLPRLAARAVVVAPSVSRWHSVSALPTQALRVATLLGPRIPHGAKEIHRVDELWRATGLATTSHPAAATANLLDAFATTDLVHVAAHGVHTQQSPLFSRLELQDGPLFAYELTGGGRVPQHVVLSACDLGRSRIGPGEEPLGLAAALLGLGVRSVVAAAGPVSDALAADVMTDYHQGLAAGMSAAQSLCAARAERRGAAIFNVYGADWAITRGRGTP